MIIEKDHSQMRKNTDQQGQSCRRGCVRVWLTGWGTGALESLSHGCDTGSWSLWSHAVQGSWGEGKEVRILDIENVLRPRLNRIILLYRT